MDNDKRIIFSNSNDVNFNWRDILIRLISLLLLSTTLTLLFPSALLFILPGDLVNNLMWLGIMSPVIWTLAMLYSYWDEKPWRPLLVMSTISVLSIVIVLILEITP